LPTEADPKIYQSKLLWQVWGLLCALVLISALSIGYFAAQQVASDARAAIEESLAHQVQLLKQFYNPLILQEAALPVIQSEQRITILGPDGTVLSDNREDAGLMENHLKRPEIIAASAQTTSAIGLGIAQRYSTTLEQDMLYVALALGSPDAPTGYVRVSTPLTSIEQKVNAMRLQVNLLTGAFTFIAILIGLYFARRIVLPVLRMTQASALMASGEFSLRLDEGHANELGSLARALNKLAAGTQAKIEEVAARQNELTVVLQGMTEGIIALNADQAVIQMNRSAATILNLEQSSVLNKPFQSLSMDVRESRAPGAVADAKGADALVAHDDGALGCDLGVLRDVEHQGIGVIPRHRRQQCLPAEEDGERLADDVRPADVALANHVIPAVSPWAQALAAALGIEHVPLGVDDVARGDGHDGIGVGREVCDLLGDGVGGDEVVLADELDELPSRGL